MGHDPRPNPAAICALECKEEGERPRQSQRRLRDGNRYTIASRAAKSPVLIEQCLVPGFPTASNQNSPAPLISRSLAWSLTNRMAITSIVRLKRSRSAGFHVMIRHVERAERSRSCQILNETAAASLRCRRPHGCYHSSIRQLIVRMQYHLAIHNHLFSRHYDYVHAKGSNQVPGSPHSPDLTSSI